MNVFYICPTCQTEQRLAPGQRFCRNCQQPLTLAPPAIALPSRPPLAPVPRAAAALPPLTRKASATSVPDRPIGLVLIVIRCGIMAISYGYETFQVLALYTQDRLTSPALGLCFAALCFMLALVSVVIPWELWFLKDWARRWMVGLMGVDLLLGMLGVLLGSPGPSSGQITGQLCGALIVNGLIVWYLLRPGIAERFSFW